MEEKKVLTIALNDILPNRFQPRLRFNEEAINELAESIKKHGVIQPIVVRPIGDKFEIIAGERRYKASSIAGKIDIPAIVADLDDRNSAEVALIENVQREDLTPIEEAISYKKILDMGYLTQTELANKLGKEQSTVANKLRLLNLSEEVQDALLEEEISERHARSLLKLDKENQTLLLKEILEKRLTVRKTDEEIDKILSISKPNSNVSSNEIEVVDFGEMGETKMPVIEEVKTQTTEPNKIDPGFIDIEKIENEAKDIFVDKPELDLNKVLNVIEEEKQEVEMEPRKFFSFLPEEQEEIVSEQKNEDIFKNFNFEEKTENLPDINPISFEPKLEEKQEEPNLNIFEPKGITNVAIKEELLPESELNSDENPFNLELPNEKVAIPQEKVEFTPYYGDDLDDIESPVVFEQKVEQIKVNEPINIRTAVNKTREFAKELESLGFVIDIDELDFEDNYQIIFKINKE